MLADDDGTSDEDTGPATPTRAVTVRKKRLLTSEAPTVGSVKKVFGWRLNRILIDRGITRSEFVRRAKEMQGPTDPLIEKHLLSNWICARNYPNDQNISFVARILGMTPEELMPASAVPAPEPEPKDVKGTEVKYTDDFDYMVINLKNHVVPTEIGLKIIALLKQAN